jgi:acyl carrier protein
MSIRQAILSEMQKIAADQNVDPVPLADDLLLSNTGFDSLCFAILVARLEDDLGFDPFSSAENASFPTTLGDLIMLYERAAPP